MSGGPCVLVVPSVHHRAAILAEGPCGARMPLAQWSELERKWNPLDDAGRRWMLGSDGEVALVLAWKGERVVPGIARALECTTWPPAWMALLWSFSETFTPPKVEPVIEFAQWLERQGRVSRVVMLRIS